MVSYREGLTKIGATGSIFYSNFVSKPKSLRQAIRSMDAPPTDTEQTRPWVDNSDNKPISHGWVQDCQGVAADNDGHWIFTNNHYKWVYVFSGGLDDGNIIFQGSLSDLLPHTDMDTLIPDSDEYGNIRHDENGDIIYTTGTPVRTYTDPNFDGNLDHVGQITFYNGCLYISHMNDNNTHIFVFKVDNGSLIYDRTIALEKPTSPTQFRTQKAEFQGINTWDGKAYTCFGDGPINELFIHYLNDGNGKKAGELVRDKNGKIKVLPLGCECLTVQGAAFSPNGHVYIACNTRAFQGNPSTRYIRYYSALNGHYFGQIVVPAEHDWHEQQGICFAYRHWDDGRRAQISSILLNQEEDWHGGSDSIWFKGFCAPNPDIV